MRKVSNEVTWDMLKERIVVVETFVTTWYRCRRARHRRMEKLSLFPAHRFSTMSKSSSIRFTLVEVMITLTILVIIGASVSQTMVTSYETKRIVTEQNGRYHEGRQVLTRMAREMRMAFLRAEVPRDKREEEPAVITRFKGTTDELYFASTAHVPRRGPGERSQKSPLFGARQIGSPYRARHCIDVRVSV